MQMQVAVGKTWHDKQRVQHVTVTAVMLIRLVSLVLRMRTKLKVPVAVGTEASFQAFNSCEKPGFSLQVEQKWCFLRCFIVAVSC